MRSRNTSAQSNRARGFTLIELLVVISIIALLISILLPALGLARERGKTLKCLANISSITKSNVMYLDDDEQRLMQWYRVPVLTSYGAVNVVTPWVFGGFQAPAPLSNTILFPNGAPDASRYPVEARLLTKYIGPGVIGRAQLDIYKDPGDRTWDTALIGQGGPPPIDEDAWSSWEVNGNSYTLNTRFMQGYNQPGGNFSAGVVVQNGYWQRIARHMDGGKASRFIIWFEQGAYSAFYRSTDNLATSMANPQKNGWHREYSKWSVGFADGHASYGYFDTRLSVAPDGQWTVWEPK